MSKYLIASIVFKKRSSAEGEKKFIDGSKNISIIQPEWSESGELIYISDESGWWNLKKYCLQCGIDLALR